MTLEVFVSEEFGYQYWVWHFPGDVEKLVRQWQRGRVPLLWGTEFSGKLRPATPQEVERFERNPKTREIMAHVHDVDDSYLRVGDQDYKPFVDNN